MNCPRCSSSMKSTRKDPLVYVCRKCGHRSSSVENSVSSVSRKKFRQSLGALKKTGESMRHREFNIPSQFAYLGRGKFTTPFFYESIDKNEPPSATKDNMNSLPSFVKRYLHKREIESLYQFQWDAYLAIRNGDNVIITASTGFGKTEAFLFGVLDNILSLGQRMENQELNNSPPEYNKPIALFIYPTKALASDQFAKIRELCSLCGLKAGKIDGDVPSDERKLLLKDKPDILITNPDFIHYHLVNNTQYHSLLISAKFVVLDEVHTYTGVWGTNVHYVLKRIKRWSPEMQFICASATIQNPISFSKLLLNLEDITLINSGNVRKSKTDIIFLLCHASMDNSMSDVANFLHKTRGERLLCFSNSHANAEKIAWRLRQKKKKAAVHRGGLSSSLRYNNEEEFKRGNLDILSSTSTLELGIDIGDLNSVLSEVCPITNMLQRIGRAGRRGHDALSFIFFSESSPTTSYYQEYPEQYFTDISPGYIEPRNKYIAYHQILAMALEKPIPLLSSSDSDPPVYLVLLDEPAQTVNSDLSYDTNITQSVVSQLISEGLLSPDLENQILVVPNERQKDVHTLLKGYLLRGIGDTVTISHSRLPKEEVATRELPAALRELYPGAIYYINGRKYLVSSFKLVLNQQYKAVLRDIPQNELKLETTAMRTVIPSIEKSLGYREVFGGVLHYCQLKIEDTVYGYGKGDEVYNLPNPISYSYSTHGFHFRAPLPTIENELPLSYDIGVSQSSQNYSILGSFHATEHVLIESSDSIIGGASKSIGGISMGTGDIVIYDGVKGGSGASQLLYERFEEAVKRSSLILKNCPCKRIDGCPKCTHSYRCGNNNQPLHKKGALNSLELMSNNYLLPYHPLVVDNPLV